MFCFVEAGGQGSGSRLPQTGRGVQEWLQKMSLDSAKVNSSPHCLMMLVNTEFCMALTDKPSPEREEEEQTVWLKETRLCINTD